MSRKKILANCFIAASLLIIMAFLLWTEFSFVLAGVAVMLIGIGLLFYINKK